MRNNREKFEIVHSDKASEARDTVVTGVIIILLSTLGLGLLAGWLQQEWPLIIGIFIGLPIGIIVIIVGKINEWIYRRDK